MTLFKDISKGADFSGCRKYRYALWRIWNEEKPLVGFVGLNPSTANENTDDPTIRRVVRFAKDWGYGGVYMLNLFGLVSPNPEDLKLADDPLGANSYKLFEYAKKCEKIVFAWGSFKEAKGQAEVAKEFLPNSYALHINADGSPKHPLYVKADTQPIKFN